MALTPDPCLLAVLAQNYARVSAAPIAVVYDRVWTTLEKGHVQRREYEASIHFPADRPTDDATAPGIQHRGQINESHPGWHGSQIGDLELVGDDRLEAAFDQVCGHALTRISVGSNDQTASSAHTANAGISHRARDVLAADRLDLIHEIGRNARHLMGLLRLSVDLAHLLGEHSVGQSAGTRCTASPRAEAASRDAQHSAHRTKVDFGPVDHHQLEVGVDVGWPFLSIQAVVCARMPCMVPNCLPSRRSRVSSSRSALLGQRRRRPFCRDPAPWPYGQQSSLWSGRKRRTRDNSAGVPPAFMGSSRCWRNSVRYVGRIFGVSCVSISMDQVSTKANQLPLEWAATVAYDQTLTGATLDRPLLHARIVQIVVECDRLEDTRKAGQPPRQ